jgi:hypothetical protein
MKLTLFELDFIIQACNLRDAVVNFDEFFTEEEFKNRNSGLTRQQAHSKLNSLEAKVLAEYRRNASNKKEVAD